MGFSRELSQELERRTRLRTIMVAASTLTPEDQAALVNAMIGESTYSLPLSLEQVDLKSMGADIFAIGLRISGGDFDKASDPNFAHIVNEAWNAVMATLLWAGAHGANLPLDEKSRDIISKEINMPVPADVTDFSSYLKWAGAAAGMGAVLLGRMNNPYARIAGLLLGGVAPLIEERAAEQEIKGVPTIVVPGPSRIGPLPTEGSSGAASVIRKAGT